MQTVAVIGAGFSGTMTAVGLLRAASNASLPAPKVILIERTGRFGTGVAFGTQSPSHLLNVPAGRMSAFPDQPDHFLQWVRARDPLATGGYFAPRHVYGQYLTDVLEQSLAGLDATATGQSRFERLTDECIAIDPPGSSSGQATLTLRSGRSVAANHVVLAFGNFPASDPTGLPSSIAVSERYVRDPWIGTRRDECLNKLAPNDPILLIGTGLTMVDVVLDLAHRGHTGVVHAVSRRGLLPQPHRSPPKPAKYDPPTGIDAWPSTARGLLHAVRAEINAAHKRHIDWREVITSLRPVTARLWNALPPHEKDRFLRHVRVFWEVHRHRSAPQADGAMQAMILAGRLVVHSGRVIGARPNDEGLQIDILDRGEDKPSTVQAACVINCTGPEANYARIDDALVQSLLARQLIHPDPHGHGLGITQDGRVLDARHQPLGWLWAVGPMTKSRYWESTAVPEIREQAAALARRLATP